MSFDKAANVLGLLLLLYQLSLILSTDGEEEETKEDEQEEVPSTTTTTEAPNFDRPCWLDNDLTIDGGDFPGQNLSFSQNHSRQIVRYGDGAHFGTINPNNSAQTEPLGPSLAYDPDWMGKLERLFLPPGEIEWLPVYNITQAGLPSNALAVAKNSNSSHLPGDNLSNPNVTIPPQVICRPRHQDNLHPEIELLGITHIVRFGESSCRCRKRGSGGVAYQPLYEAAVFRPNMSIPGQLPKIIGRCYESNFTTTTTFPIETTTVALTTLESAS